MFYVAQCSGHRTLIGNHYLAQSCLFIFMQHEKYKQNISEYSWVNTSGIHRVYIIEIENTFK